MAAPPVQSIGNYQVVAELARGNMGVVYRAHDPVLDRPVAVKVILAQEAGEGDLARFRVEARATARLHHPNIVGILAAGQVQGKPYIVMELIEGGSLQQALKKRGPFPGAEAARIVERVARAVDYAHELGVLHRDIKPANVLLDTRGEPQLTDFGLAKLMGRDTKVTLTGEITGTPVYMAPEQALGEKEKIGPQTDVYALGATLYELVTGQAPFMGTTVVGLLTDVINTQPTPPSKVLSSIDRELERICLRALAKEPGDRFASAGAFAAALADYQKSRRPARDRLAELPPREASATQRNAAFAVAGVAALLAVGLGVAWRGAAGQASRAEARVDALEPELSAAKKAAEDSERARQAALSELRQAEGARDERGVALADALVGRARLLRERGRLDEADADAAAALEIVPDHLPARIQRADVLVARFQYAQALSELDPLLREHPKDARALFVAAQARLALDSESPQALGELRAVLEAEPGNVHARVLLGRTLFLLGKDDDALRALDQAVDSQDAPAVLRAWALSERARLNQQVGRTGRAQGDIETALRIAPTAPCVTATTGFLLTLRNQGAEALRAFQQAIKVDASYPWTYFFRAGLYQQSRQPALAKQDYEHALRLGLTSLQTYSLLGQALVEQGDFRAAEVAFSRSLEITPTASNYAFRAGVRVQTKDLAGAREDFAKAKQLTPRADPQQHRRLLERVESLLQGAGR